MSYTSIPIATSDKIILFMIKPQIQNKNLRNITLSSTKERMV